MPSPIAHWTIGLVVCRWLWPRRQTVDRRQTVPWRWLIPASLVLSLLPDSGSVVGLITGDFGRYHNSWEHSFFAGLACALLGALIAWSLGSGAPWRWFALVLLCFEIHVAMDFFTIGRGVRVLWPFSEARYSPPIKLFYGVHWSDGWLTPRHLVTLLSETAFVAVVVVGAWLWPRRRSNPN